jgi:hypothetical protein
LVLGDLTFDEAYEFYLDTLEKKFGQAIDSSLYTTSKDGFKDVFHMTGGRMWFIRDFINQISQTGQRIESGNIDLNSVIKFAPVVQEFGILSILKYGCSDFNKEDFRVAVGRLFNSRHGYYPYEDLFIELGKGDTEVGKKKISALIKRNVLHFRPASDLARDLIPFPDYNVVTATGTPALRAMERIIHGK